MSAMSDGVALGLAGLLASSFLSATVLPGNSELALIAFLRHAPEWQSIALGVATLGNTAGGLTSYALGRVLPRPPPTRVFAWSQRAGPPALLLAWVPIVGDGLCVASGWLRQSVWQALLWMAAGKLARYWIVAEGASRLLPARAD